MTDWDRVNRPVADDLCSRQSEVLNSPALFANT